MNCHICKSNTRPKLILENRNSLNSIYRCSNCKITFVDPQPSITELNKYYNGMYKELTVSFDKEKMEMALYSMKGYLKQIDWNKKNVNKKTFLDLGGGLGYYSKAAAEFGMKSILVEKDPVSINFAKNQLGINNIIEKDLKDFFCNNIKKYDLVFFRHVIEHVTEPFEVINNISNILNENGILIIETDNNAGIEILFKKGVRKFYINLYKKNFKEVNFLKLMIKRPFALDPPRHLFGFRMENLSFLLETNSLKPFVKKHYRLGHPIYWPNIYSPSFKAFFKYFLKLKFKKSINELIGLFNLCFRILLQLLGFSSGLCIYAKKINK